MFFELQQIYYGSTTKSFILFYFKKPFVTLNAKVLNGIRSDNISCLKILSNTLQNIPLYHILNFICPK